MRDIVECMRELKQEGYFEEVEKGSDRAASYFVRLAAWRSNPTGDPRGWGCLRKTAGGKNIDGYSEDALVLGADPNNFNNVVDFVGGAGRAGATLNTNATQFVSRRAQDVWEAPRALRLDELAVLKPFPPPSIEQPPVEQPQLQCKCDCKCEAQPCGVSIEYLDMLLDSVDRAEEAAKSAARQVEELHAKLDAGLRFEGGARWIGRIEGVTKWDTTR